MTDDDPKIIKSPLCRTFTADGITVSVEIYRLETSDGWSLELVDQDWNSTVWEELFATDQAAWEEFQRGIRELGLARLLEGDKPTTLH
jgi:hypothetical protein